MEETEVTYEPYRFLTKLSPEGKPDYSVNNLGTRIINSPAWTEFDQFVSEMKKYLIENVPKKTNKDKAKNNSRPDNIGGFTFFVPGQHVERTENGGNI